MHLYAYKDDLNFKMDSKHGKRHNDDGIRGEGNVTACLAVPLSEELVPGKGTCSNKGFEFRTALFLIDYNPTDVIV